MAVRLPLRKLSPARFRTTIAAWWSANKLSAKAWCRRFPALSENTGLALTTARYYTPSGRLIQRDYKDVSLYDYLYNHKNPPPTEVKLTDSGRQVTGGGGITPDVS